MGILHSFFAVTSTVLVLLCWDNKTKIPFLCALALILTKHLFWPVVTFSGNDEHGQNQSFLSNRNRQLINCSNYFLNFRTVFYYIGWNDKIVAREKTTWFHFRLMKTSFLFVADHQLVGQLCTNPKSDRSLLSCLKVKQCSTSEIGDAPLYKSCSLLIQLMTTGPLPAPSKCKSGRFNVPRVTKTKFPATVMVFGVVSSEVHIMPPHIFEVGLKVNTKVYLDVLKRVVIPLCNQVAGVRPWVWQQESAPAHKSN